MNTRVSKSQLKQMLRNICCDDICEKLKNQHQECLEKVKRYEDTGSRAYGYQFNTAQLEWLSLLIRILSSDRRKRDFSRLNTRYPQNDYFETLMLLGFDSDAASKIDSKLSALSGVADSIESISELEKLAIKCGLISRCYLCEHGAFTTGYYSEKPCFRGCARIDDIKSPVMGDCTFFIRALDNNDLEEEA